MSKPIVLLYGHTGWIGSQLLPILENAGFTVVKSSSRLEEYSKLGAELDRVNPQHVVCTAGMTGSPNIDQLEEISYHIPTLHANVLGPSILANECYWRQIHFVLMATGCIFEYDKDHPLGSGKGFTEEDTPNFSGSYYSKTKIWTEGIIKEFPTSLILRLRMPISDDLHPRSFITKISTYKRVINIPNSVSILYDLLPLIPEMLKMRICGILNFVNVGTISHAEILDLYKKYIDPTFNYTIFSLEEQAKILKAGRSNNELDTTKLLSYFPEVPHIKNSIVRVFERMAHN